MAKEKVTKAKGEEAKEKVEGEETAEKTVEADIAEEDANIIEGVENQVTPRFEETAAGKKMAIFFVLEVKGGSVLYNEKGVRVSGLVTEPSQKAYLSKAAARNNAIMRSNRVPQDK